LNRVMCRNASIALNITALSPMQDYPIIIYAYSLKNPSNLPVSTAYTFINNLTTGNSITAIARWQKPINESVLLKVCNAGGFCETGITPC